MAASDDHPLPTLTLNVWESLTIDQQKVEARRRNKRVGEVEAELQLAQAVMNSSAQHVSRGIVRSRPDPRPANVVSTAAELGASSTSDRDGDDVSFAIDGYLPHDLLPDALAGYVGALENGEDLEVGGSSTFPNKFAGKPMSGGRGGQGGSRRDQDREVVLATSQAPPRKTALGCGDGDAVADVDEDDSACLLRMLSADLAIQILRFLDGDSLGFTFRSYRAFGAQHLPGLALEGLFESLCHATYLKQSRHKMLDGSKWGGFRNMWLRRPRVRTNGIYVMATEWLKQATHDMWGGVASSVHSLKVQTFRYFRFLPNGVVLYTLTHAPPDKVASHLVSAPSKAQLREQRRAASRVDGGGGGNTPDVFLGTYSLHKNQVMVRVTSHYNVVNFQLVLSHGRRGHFCRLQVAHHYSRPLSVPASSVQTYHLESKGYTFLFLRAYPRLS